MPSASIKIDKKTLRDIRIHIKKTGQTIAGFLKVAAANEMRRVEKLDGAAGDHNGVQSELVK